MKILVKDVAYAFGVLNAAKYQKLSDDDKIKVWKIVRAMKPVAMKYADDLKDAEQKLMPSDDFRERMMKAQHYEMKRSQGASDLPMTGDEYLKAVEEHRSYQALVDKAVKEYGDAEVDIVFDKITEDAFCRLMSSNDWTMEQAVKVGEMIVE